METFAKSLPGMRARAEEDLARRGLVRERVLACSVRLLDLGFFRIGSERYAEENETYGLSTLLRRHVKIEAGEAVFDYSAKDSKRHRQTIADPAIVKTIKALKDRDGQAARAARLAQWPQRLGRRHRRRHQRVPQGEHRRRLQRQGLPHLERDRAGGGRAGDERHRARRRRRRESERRPRRSSASRSTSTTRRPSVARPTSIPGSSTATTAARRSAGSLKLMVAGQEPGEFVEREKIERAVLKLLK